VSGKGVSLDRETRTDETRGRETGGQTLRYAAFAFKNNVKLPCLSKYVESHPTVAQ